MIRASYIIFSLFFLTLINSCDPFNKSDEVKIRLVNLEGKSRRMYTRIPDLNLKALADQKKLGDSNENLLIAQNQQNLAIQNIEASKPNLVRDTSYNEQAQEFKQQDQVDFGQFSSQTIKDSLGQKNKFQEPTAQVNYDLSQTKKSEDVKNQPKKLEDQENSRKNSPAPLAKNLNQKEIFIQVGAFSNENNAKNFLKFMRKFSDGKIEKTKTINNGYVHRVLLGPMENIDRANTTMVNIKNSGHDAILIKK